MTLAALGDRRRVNHFELHLSPIKTESETVKANNFIWCLGDDVFGKQECRVPHKSSDGTGALKGRSCRQWTF